MPEDQHDHTPNANPVSPPEADAPFAATAPASEPAPWAQSTNPVAPAETIPAHNNLLMYAAVFGGLVVVGGLIWYFLAGRDTTLSTPLSNTTTPVTNIDPATFPEVVAVINGQEISNEAMAASVQNITREARAQGLDPADATISAQINEQAMITLVNKTLLLQAASSAGIEAAPERVDSELAALETQLGGAEAFDAQIQSFGLSRAQVRSDVVEQLVIDEYLSSNEQIASIEVSDSEIQTLYDQVAASGQQLPPLEEVRGQVEAQIQTNKQQAAITSIIEALRADGTIEILL